jgi:hypothetical protein
MQRLFHAPYRDERNSVQFDGYGWVVVAVVPWAVGAFTIVSWLS